ncbi:heavy metal-associated isoprenylated plant protein 39-like [Impatiens glandulifera]|uniref:heavy metal-associated isoprenylated plant protein 39-like n=1 Tax=Impatiens glandulifera TaxID=253017 RepID=UPI001FB15CBB|nr:heavy metal-associated isoprenylated plant protein 39-like [Impatiens glandulifera]
MEKKKLVIKLEVHDHKGKQRAMKAVSSFPGVESISMDAKENKITLLGFLDPVKVVAKLRKLGHAEIVTVGPPDKPKEEPKKEEVVKKPEEKKGDDDKKKEEKQIADLVKAYQDYNPAYTRYYNVHSIEENPNSCVIS